MSVTYSFLDVNCSISGPGGSVILSEGGVAGEGITIAFVEDKSSMLIGADGEGMHSLKATKAARITVRLLKNSPLNAALNAMYRFQTTGTGAYHGQNTISLSNPLWGDEHACQQCAFVKHPDNVNAIEGGTNEWLFDSIKTDTVLGDGSLVL